MGALALLSSTASANAANPTGPLLFSFEFDGEGTSRATFEDMEFTIDATGPSQARGPRLRASRSGKSLFEVQLAGESPNGSAMMKVVRLEGRQPQIVFQHYTFGAHCCIVTRIATLIDGRWQVIKAGAQDGDGGYDFVDIAGDGFAELVGADQSFLYAFAGYASSRCPILLQRLEGASLIDVTRNRLYRQAVVADLEAMEPRSADDERWHDNGFLAAWVATKALLGEGPSAWRRMLKNYNSASGRTMKFATFPETLRVHLRAHGYITDIDDYPLTRRSTRR